jgi:uncharacterized protein YqgV (UPF0045/DUF77 family)
LQDSFKPTLIKSLRALGLIAFENPLSTKLYGDYDAVMSLLHREMKVTLEAIDKGLIYMKIAKFDRSQYEPHF